MRSSLAAMAVAVVACQKPMPSAPVPPATTAPVPAPTPIPAPTPVPTPTPVPFQAVRVAFFGITCGGEKGPNNTSRKLPVGCKGAVTATPKFEDGSDVPPEDHGPDIRWELVHGELMVRLGDVPGVPFNKDVFGRRPGPFQLCATVRDVTGCLNGEVVP